jgi:hypothetical protein
MSGRGGENKSRSGNVLAVLNSSNERLAGVWMLRLERLKQLRAPLIREVRVVFDRLDELEDLHVCTLEFLALELVLVDLKNRFFGLKG